MFKQINPDKNFEASFEYAWRWFEFHAKQRVSMFNFFLISVGILANAYVLLIIGNLPALAGSLAVVSTIMCFIFILLDRRNHQLVSLGEEALKSVEQSIWQRQEASCTNDERGSIETGLLSQEKSLKPVPFYLKHWFLIESFESLVGIAFFIAAIYAFVGWL